MKNFQQITIDILDARINRTPSHTYSSKVTMNSSGYVTNLQWASRCSAFLLFIAEQHQLNPFQVEVSLIGQDEEAQYRIERKDDYQMLSIIIANKLIPFWVDQLLLQPWMKQQVWQECEEMERPIHLSKLNYTTWERYFDKVAEDLDHSKEKGLALAEEIQRQRIIKGRQAVSEIVNRYEPSLSAPM